MRKPKPSNELLPFRPIVGQRFGAGKDNHVYRLSYAPEGTQPNKVHLQEPTGLVLKVNHLDERIPYTGSREQAWRGIQYKKNKYDILKYFLGSYIPDSSFILSQVKEGEKTRYGELIVQDEVPRVSLNELTEDQKNDPRLKAQIIDLMSKLQYMYSVIGEANARASHDVNLDGKLDLGGVSDRIKIESVDHNFNDSDAQEIINSNTSPNLLVDPATMQLYCIDFDQGKWKQGMDEAKDMVFKIDQARKQNSVVQDIAQLALFN